MVIAALLVLPVAVLADPTIDAIASPFGTIPPGPGGDIFLNPSVHTSIIVDVVINTTMVHWGAAYTITIEKNGGGLGSGDSDWIFDITDPHMIGYIYPTSEYMAGVGLGAGGGGGNTIATVSSASSEQYMSFINMYSGGGLLARHELVPVWGNIFPGDVYDIYLWTDAYGKGVGLADVATGGSVPWTGGQVLIVIIPEPATALMMLFAAIPLLRKKR